MSDEVDDGARTQSGPRASVDGDRRDLRPLIVRVFRARVHPGKEDEFERFVIDTGVPMVKAAEGCTHVTAGKSRWNEQPEFVVVTHWRSVDALQAFAGPDWQKAVIEPQEEHTCLPRSSAITTKRSKRAQRRRIEETSGTLHSRGECRLVRSRT